MKILAIGYYGYSNFGDEALLHTLYQLVQKFKGVSFTALSNSAQPGMHTVCRKNILGIVRQIIRSDLVIVGGGGIFQNETSNRSLICYCGLLLLCMVLRKKTLVLGAGFVPIRGFTFQLLTALSVWKSRITVRDEISKEFLESYGLRVEKASDLLFSSRANEQNTGEQDSGTLRVFLNVRNFSNDGFKALTELVTELASEDVDLYLLSLAPEDTESLNQILRHCKVKIKGYSQLYRNPAEFTTLVNGNSLVLGMRLHSLILALLHNIPFAVISDSEKLGCFANESEFPIFSPFNAYEVITFVREVRKNYSLFSEKARQAHQEQKQKAAVNERALVAELGQLSRT